MYGKHIKFLAINIHRNVVQQSTTKFRLYPSNCFSSTVSTQPKKESNLVDDIRSSASGMPPSPPIDDRVNVVKTSTTQTSSPTFTDKRDDNNNDYNNNNNNGGDMSSYVADTAKQGVVKAMETGLEIGEMAKKTLDNIWDASKDTTHAIKEAVAGDDKANNDVPPTDKFVDDLRQHADGYDLRKKYGKGSKYM